MSQPYAPAGSVEVATSRSEFAGSAVHHRVPYDGGTGKIQKYRMREFSIAELGLGAAEAVRTA